MPIYSPQKPLAPRNPLEEFFSTGAAAPTPGLRQDNAAQSAQILRNAPTLSNQRADVEESSFAAAEQGDSGAMDVLSQFLRGEEEAAKSDPWAQHYRDVGKAQSEATIYNEPSVRQQREEEQQFTFDKEAVAPNINANSARDVENIKQQGALNVAETNAAAKTGGAAGQQAGPSAYGIERSKRTTDLVDQILPQVDRWTTGWGSYLSFIPETDAANMEAELNSLKGNIAFNELTAMREASKTGGALGQVSNIELGLLESALGALSTKQSPANLKEQLLQIKQIVDRWNQMNGVVAGGSMGDDDEWETVQ
jgi:hypothetical protein